MTTIEIPVWQLIGGAVTLLGVLAGLFKLLLLQTERRLDQRFAVMDERYEAVARDGERLRQVELGLERLRGEMPLHYVRREDYVRNQTVIEAKLDALALKLENVQLKGAR
ncbi:membrane protein [Pseudomonas oryzihabitans]|nr:membrane protein [Pseudomonas psychrotolerans]